MKTTIPSSFWFPSFRNHVLLVCQKSILFLAALMLSLASSGQVQLVENINIHHDTFENEYRKAVDCNGILYFTSKNELWKTNSKSSGTTLVKKFQMLGDMISYSDAVYFIAADKSGDGPELWRSKGTAYSTVRVKDIRPGGWSSGIAQLTVAGSYLFFVADNGTNGKELWRTNGTSAGTVIVKDIMAKGGSSNPAFLTNANGILYFAANDGVNGYELWKSDGTAEGTVLVKDIKTGSRLGSAPGSITNVNGIVYFTADDGVAGRELWKSDGTSAGTVLVKDFTAGGGSTAYHNLTGVNNTLFFSANDKIHGEEVWKSDGTSVGTAMVADLYPGITKGYPGVAALGPSVLNFASVNGKLYFTAFGADEYYFWKTDGTAAGTVPLTIAKPLGGAVVTPFFTYYNGSVFFINGGGESNGIYTYNLLKEDSTGKITTISTLLLNTFYDSSVPFLVYSRNLLYFTGRRSETDGYALFKTSGTVASTQFVADSYTVDLPSNPSNFVKIGNTVYFIAKTGSPYIAFSETQNLWKTDGTSAGTIQVTELQKVQNITNVNGTLYFAGLDIVNGWGIYKTDGTPAGTTAVRLLAPISTPHDLINVNGTLFVTFGSNQIITIKETTISYSFLAASVPSGFPLGDYLYFVGTDDAYGSELWRTKSVNGVATGTKLVKDINPNGNSNIEHFAVLNGVLYFSANDGVHGHELWRSDGTIGGTRMVIDTRTGDSSAPYLNDVIDIVTIGDKLYFSTPDYDNEPTIWKSDGTSANTTMVSNVPKHSPFMVSNSRLYFVTDSLNNFDLWKSDGTAETTHYLATLNEGNGFYSPNSYVTIDDVFYSNLSGEYLWRSNGSPCGTYVLSSVAGYPSSMEFLGNEIIFAADYGTVGRELYKVNVAQLPESPCLNTLQSLVSNGEEGLSHYPNPFQNSFTLELKGNREENYSIRIVDLANQPFETKSAMRYDESYELGTQLLPGFYLLRIQEQNKTRVVKIIKR
jgi:ELWxxDGT repeat protein